MTIEERAKEFMEEIYTSGGFMSSCNAVFESLLAQSIRDAVAEEHAKVARLEAALKWYADPKNYEVSISGQSPVFDDADGYPENASFGKRAREALMGEGKP